MGLVALLEVELLGGPDALDRLELLLDLGLLLSDIHDLVDLGLELVQLQAQDVVEVEVRTGVVEGLPGLHLDFLPVPLLHELGVQGGHQRQDDAHVLSELSQRAVPIEALDLLWQVLDLQLHAFVELEQGVGFDGPPLLGLPVLVHVHHHQDVIPHGLEVPEVLLAVLDLLVVGLLELEQLLQVSEVVGLFLDLLQLLLVVLDLVVGLVDHHEVHVSGEVEGQVLLEVVSELLDSFLELLDPLSQVLLLLVLLLKDLGLDLDDHLAGLSEHVVLVVDGLQWLFLSLLLQDHPVLFELGYHVLHSLDDALGLRLDVLDVGDDLHHTHQQSLVLEVLVIRRVSGDALLGGLDEVLDVLQGDLVLVLQETSVDVDPHVDLGVERRFQGLD